MIKQNFTTPNLSKPQDIEKYLMVEGKTYYLRGAIHFHEGERRGLRYTTGHYKASTYRGNDKWETYDDTKDKIVNTKISNKIDVEFLIYTI